MNEIIFTSIAAILDLHDRPYQYVWEYEEADCCKGARLHDYDFFELYGDTFGGDVKVSTECDFCGKAINMPYGSVNDGSS